MKALAGGLLLALVCSTPLAAQEKDRSLERIQVALQQPPSLTWDVAATEAAGPTRLGILTLVPPQQQGEIVRISVPIGELVSRAFRRIAAAKQRREERAARRQVEAELQWFEQQRSSRQR